MHKTIALSDAVKKIPDGASVMIGGFLGVGSPHRILAELVRQGRKSLTVIANDTARPGVGIGLLIAAKTVRKSKVVKQCTLPLTSIRPVNLVITELAVIEPSDQGLVLKERAPGVTVEKVIAATEALLIIPPKVPEMAISPPQGPEMAISA
jgi:acetate CoA/acetoacetate CoA-transferase alpha subunit